MTGQEVLALVKKHGNQSAAAKAAGVAKSTFQEWVKKAKLNVEMEAVERKHGGGLRPATVAPKQSVKTLADFRSTYDKNYIIPQRIKDGLRVLGSGWEYEVQFAKIAGVSLTDLSTFREQFAAHVVPLKRDGKRAWAGTVNTAKAMREML